MKAIFVVYSTKKNIQMKNLLVLLLLTSGLCFAQQENYKQLDSYLEVLNSNEKIMGSMSIMKDGKMDYEKSVGYQYKNEKEERKANKKSKYRIGSITKTFTAVMIFQLVDEKKMSLEDKLSKYYPQIPNASKITIANLLCHKSGLFNITGDADFGTWILLPATQSQMLARIQKHKVDFQPGEKTAYSNTNFILLGYILEKIEKKTYGEILKKRIVKKLKLKDTYYGGTIDTNKNECQSYYYENDVLKSASVTHMSNPGGAGAIVSTPSDLVCFLDALFNNKLLSKESFKEMTKSTNEGGMGSGITSLEKNGQIIFGHNGRIDGFVSFAIYIPEIKTAIAINTNAANFSMMPIIFNALTNVNGKTFTMPNSDVLELTEKEVKTYEGTYESKDLPFDLVFVAEGKILKGGPNLKELHNLKATKKNEFTLENFGATLKFDDKKSSLFFVEPTMSSPVQFTKKK